MQPTPVVAPGPAAASTGAVTFAIPCKGSLSPVLGYTQLSSLCAPRAPCDGPLPHKGPEAECGAQREQRFSAPAPTRSGSAKTVGTAHCQACPLGRPDGMLHYGTRRPVAIGSLPIGHRFGGRLEAEWRPGEQKQQPPPCRTVTVLQARKYCSTVRPTPREGGETKGSHWGTRDPGPPNLCQGVA